jgi:hypothetical protein
MYADQRIRNGDYMTINEEKSQFVESMLDNFDGKIEKHVKEVY